MSPSRVRASGSGVDFGILLCHVMLLVWPLGVTLLCLLEMAFRFLSRTQSTLTQSQAATFGPLAMSFRLHLGASGGHCSIGQYLYGFICFTFCERDPQQLFGFPCTPSLATVPCFLTRRRGSIVIMRCWVCGCHKLVVPMARSHGGYGLVCSACRV